MMLVITTRAMTVERETLMRRASEIMRLARKFVV